MTLYEVFMTQELMACYIGHPYFLREFKYLLEKIGKRQEDDGSFLFDESLLEQVSKGDKSPLKAKVWFFQDSVNLAQHLVKYSADVIFIDERPFGLQKPMKAPLETKLRKEKISCEDIKKSIVKFTPSDFHFPNQRVVAIIDENSAEKRIFELGVASVRSVIRAPHSPIKLLKKALMQVKEFRTTKTRKALCIGGGGLEGYLYSLGAVCALEEATEGSFAKVFDIFSGVSSGAILCAPLAANIDPMDLKRQVYGERGDFEPLTTKIIFDFASSEVLERILWMLRSLPRLRPEEIVSRLRRILPLGFFKGEKLARFIKNQLEKAGCADSFRAMEKELYITATDSDTRETVTFGKEPWRDVPVSRAIRASTALPPFYLPEELNGHWFSDGQITSPAEFQTAIQRGAGFVVFIDPIVAYTTDHPGKSATMGGYFNTVQAVKSLVESRSDAVFRHTQDTYPDVDFFMFKPKERLMEAMAGNPMKFRIRKEVVALSHHATLLELLEKYESASYIFARHGIQLVSRSELNKLVIKAKGNIR